MKMQSNNVAFGQCLRNVKFNNTKYASGPQTEATAKDSSMIIDGKEIKTGDAFYIMNNAGQLTEAKFKGAYDTATCRDEFGQKENKIMFSKKGEPQNLEHLSAYRSFVQVFSLEGLTKLGTQVEELTRQASRKV